MAGPMSSDRFEVLGVRAGRHQDRGELYDLLAFRQGFDLPDRMVVPLKFLEQQVSSFRHRLGNEVTQASA